MVSYQTAWLKANHPVEFMAAVMNCDIHLTDKLAIYKREADRMGLRIVPPCVNRSQATFSVRDGQIVYALGALKNVGVDAMRLIVAARGDTPFRDLTDFARRVDLKKVGKRPLEMLARAGAFDALDRSRQRVFDNLDALVAWSAASHEAAGSGQVSLFAGGDDLPPPRLTGKGDWLPMDRLAHEHAAVGFYLSGHPLDDYSGALRRKDVLTLAALTRKAQNGPVVARIAGSVSARQERKSARGNRFAFVSLSDPTGLYEVTVFSDVLDVARAHLEPGLNVVLTVEATLEGDSLKLLCRGAQPIDEVVADAGAAGLRIWIDGPPALAGLQALLQTLPPKAPRKSLGPLWFRLPDPTSGGEIEIDSGLEIPVSPTLKQQIRALDGVLLVEEA